MTTCPSHTEFFDDMCPKCEKEYSKLKGIGEENFGIEAIVSTTLTKIIMTAIGVRKEGIKTSQRSEQKNSTESF
jgi:hypothetical protein